MKTRIGFVSNSSSSSFIIAVRKRENEQNLIDVLEKMSEHKPFYLGEDSAIRAVGQGAILDMLKKWAEEDECEIEPDQYGLINAQDDYLDESKWDVAWIDVGYSEHFFAALLGEIEKCGDIRVIYHGD